MTDPRNISIQEFSYHLPEEKIAFHPLKERDASKLLIYRKGFILEDIYGNIADYLPRGSLLVFNNSKVIHARIRFKKESGGTIEIFCLEPYEWLNEYSQVMNQAGSVKWKCMVGGVAKWKSKELEKELIINGEKLIMKALLLEKLEDCFVIEFSWNPCQYSFAEVIEQAGDIPLPPYIKRSTEPTDESRYQTIYAKHEGSVAAPTAGLHFTENIFKNLAARNIERAFVTLHVGAGTFKPVKASTMKDHDMHAEWIDVSIDMIKELILKKGEIITVGTTSLRTIETLYWLGIKASLDPESEKLVLGQWEVYEQELQRALLHSELALQKLINWMEERNLDRIITQTQLLITKGYQFKIVKALITNFHQPQSTLLLLVAAAIGEDWRKIYDYALEHQFRFLSYGDGNLIFIS